jgi:hypothetical protein
MQHPVPLKRRIGAWLALAALVTSTLVPDALADAEKRVLVDIVGYEPTTQQLTINVDILDPDGEPMPKVEAGDLQVLLNGKAVTLSDVQIETADKANEPVAICVLMNASASYQQQAGEAHSTYDQEKEGVGRLIKTLSNNDKVAVLRYREGAVHEVVYSWASNTSQAKEAVEQDKVPTGPEEGNEQLQGAQQKARSLAPETLTAIDKALSYMADNEEKLSQARRKFLLIMSDGKNREVDVSKLQNKLKDVLERYSDKQIRVFAIGFTADDPKYLPLLQTVANSTGGVYKRIETDKFINIPGAWDALGRRIKKQFIIRAKLAELPDWGDPIKGKDELKYNLVLKAKLKDGATEEGVYNDLRLPKASIAWGKILKWVGIGVGGLLGLLLLVWLIRMMLQRKSGGGAAPVADGGSQRPDGPHRGRVSVIAGPMAGNEFYLVDDVTTIGRIKGNTIVIPDPSVSSRHAALKIDQMRYEIADLNSQNKVLVNGQQVNKVYLKDGDRVKLGDTEFQFWLK